MSIAALALAAACAPQARPVTVAQLVSGTSAFGSGTTALGPEREVVVAGRAENVQPFLPERGPSGITFRLTDGSGSIQVFHEGTLGLHTGELVQVRGVARETAGGTPQLRASTIWIVGRGAPS